MAKIFNYEGFQDNNPKNGMIEADTAEAAIEQLGRQGIVVIGIQESEVQQEAKSDAFDTEIGTYKAKKIKNKDKVLFTKKLATMVKSGLPILKTLRMLETQSENKHLRVVAKQIRMTVEGGATLSQAFSMHKEVFDAIFINLLKAGESSGKLTVFLDRLVSHLEKIERIRRKIKSALMYPIILLIVAISVITLMLVKVVPVFQQMFSSVGNDLPGPTKLIVSISEFIRDPAGGPVLLFTIFAFFYTIKTLKKKSPRFKEYYDIKILKIPVFGEVIIKSSLAKVAMISSNLSAAGVSVVNTLDIVAKSVQNTVFLKAFDNVKQGVMEGKRLSKLYSEQPVIPPTFWQMIEVGEETGRVDDMLNAVANYYEEEFDLVVDRMTEMLEPIMIVFMGITIGFIIIAMYMPIFQIGKVVSSG